MNGGDAMERSYSCRMSKCAKLSDTKHRETEAQSFYFLLNISPWRRRVIPLFRVWRSRELRVLLSSFFPTESYGTLRLRVSAFDIN